MTMCTFLSKRGATYYFRRTIPAELRPLLGGKAEFMVSLRIKDREEAKRLIPAETITSQALLDEASRRLPAKHRAGGPRTQSPQSTAYDAAAWDRGREGAAIESSDIAEKQARRDGAADAVAFLAERIAGSTKELTPDLRAIRYLVDDKEFDRKVLGEHLGAARVEVQRLEAELAAARAELVAPLRAVPEASPAKSESGTMLDTDIIELWAAERKVVTKGKDTHAAVARWFYERTSRKPVRDITRKDVLAFKVALVDEGQTPANIKMKLSRLRTLLQWAADNDHAESNVASGITIKDTDAAKNKRKEFDLASLNAIFASPVYADGARPAAGKGEAAYWLPLLALYTGARMEELGQLRPADVQQISYPDGDGIDLSSWFIRIQEDADDSLRLKNAASERDVPVHPELERLGFLAFVAAATKAKQERLFPKLNANIYGRLTAKWGEWFGPYLRGTCGVTDKRMVFHSFRHTFKQYARHAGIIEGVQRQIMGHGSSDVADDYGSGYPLHQVVEGMGLYKVPGLGLPAASKQG
ncbi:site-specific recombinase XerD [Sphingomonas sp. PP-CC-3G-468]|nr:site-specific recombinase XerD [Sphingomonas sp. PP-CC-1A-547]TCM10065.1 site-specific recombinase XerD [Sphingomonas sp. PP-CC-3G-468]